MIHCNNCDKGEAVLASPLNDILCDPCLTAYLMGQANLDAGTEEVKNHGGHVCMTCSIKPACRLVYLLNGVDCDPHLLCETCWLAFLKGQRNPTVELKEIVRFIAGDRRDVEGYPTWFITAVFDGDGEPYYIEPQPIAEATQ